MRKKRGLSPFFWSAEVFRFVDDGEGVWPGPVVADGVGDAEDESASAEGVDGVADGASRGRFVLRAEMTRTAEAGPDAGLSAERGLDYVTPLQVFETGIEAWHGAFREVESEGAGDGVCDHQQDDGEGLVVVAALVDVAEQER